jgi:hypothetical protein
VEGSSDYFINVHLAKLKMATNFLPEIGEMIEPKPILNNESQLSPVSAMKTNHKEIEVSKLDDILSFLATSTEIDLENFDFLVYGGGGQTKKFYRDLAMDKEVEILWTGWPGPRWTSILSFIPGQAGLVKLLKQTRLKTLFEDLAVLSVSYLYYVPKSITGKISTDVAKAPYSHHPRKILESEKQYLFMEVEMDDTITRKSKEYYVFDYGIGVDTKSEIQNLFTALSF